MEQRLSKVPDPCNDALFSLSFSPPIFSNHLFCGWIRVLFSLLVLCYRYYSNSVMYEVFLSRSPGLSKGVFAVPKCRVLYGDDFTSRVFAGRPGEGRLLKGTGRKVRMQVCFQQLTFPLFFHLNTHKHTDKHTKMKVHRRTHTH